jgi:predicted HAD superfamily hydrolase
MKRVSLSNTSVYHPGAVQMDLLALQDRYDVLEVTQAEKVTNTLTQYTDKNKHTVFSFDVFDTLLLRNHRAELSRFVEVSQQVALHLTDQMGRGFSAEQILMARLLANRLSYRLSRQVEGCREGTISDIYRSVLTQLQLAPTQAHIDACIEIELQYECTQLVVNHPLMAFIQNHVQHGGRVVYVSDMYLNAHQINALFTRLGVDVGLFALHVSSADTLISKRSALIWPWLLDTIGVVSADVVHVGDSFHSDYVTPRTHAINAVHLPIPLQMRRDILADHYLQVQRLEKHGLPIQNWMAQPHW